jgi:CheY-like chemotaxis protein
MNPSPVTASTILIVTENATDAELVKDMLHLEFPHIFVSTDPDKAAEDFVQYRPRVLILSFNSLEKSENYYVGLHHQCDDIHRIQHRTLILCNKNELKRVYELCKKNYFDDYILFWPMTHDSLRLPMTVHHAIKNMAELSDEGPSAAEFAFQARHLADLENNLEQKIVKGEHYIQNANHIIDRATQRIGTTLDDFSKRIIAGRLNGLVTDPVAEGLINELSRYKSEEIQPQLSASIESIQSLLKWAQELRQGYKPLKENINVISSLGKLIHPLVLVVDDNEQHRNILGRVLKTEKYNMIFANDGFEALIVLRKARPDIILMDMMMPNMNGMETTRKIKSIPDFINTPIIMITGKSEGSVVVDCQKAGAIDFIVKPYEHKKLIEKISNALNVSHPCHR